MNNLISDKKMLFNKRQLNYYYENKEVYKNYYEKNKERIRLYNSNYKKNKYIKKDKSKSNKKKNTFPVIIQKGVFILDFD